MPIKNYKLKPEVDMTDKYVDSLRVLHNVLKKASKIVGGGGDMGAGIALQLIEEVKGYKLIKIKDNGFNN